MKTNLFSNKQDSLANNVAKEENRQQTLIELEKKKRALEAKLTLIEEEKEKRKVISDIEKLNSKINKVKTGKLMSSNAKKTLVAYSFILPNFIGFAIFTLGPIIFAYFLAFMSWDGNNAITFVGLDNFKHLLTDTRFKAAFINTIVYCIATVPLTLGASLGLAMLLNQKIKAKGFFRTVAFFPYVASLVAVAAVWNMIFSPGAGIVNVLLTHLGVAKASLPKWAADPKWAMFTVVLFSVWKSMGYYMVIYLAGLQGISAELYEAASMDGAGTFKKFRYITWPQLKPTTFFVVIMLTINCFKVYDQVYMLTQGGPGTSTLVLVYHIYQTAFVTANDYGYASAIAMVLFALVLLVTLIQFKGEKNYAND